MEPIFLTIDEIMEIHEDQIARYGGSPGLRDADLLESALAQPAVSFGG
jgi:death-on-curing protein